MMEYLGDNGGLSSDQMEKVLQFQDLTGTEDIAICRDVLQRHQWNLEVAVQEQLNIKEGRPSVYATEARPPAVVSDHIGQLHFYPSAEAGSHSAGFGNLVRNFIRFVLNVCYNSMIIIFNTALRLLGNHNRPAVTNPLEDVMNFVRTYDEKYSPNHPVFYQGTYNQVLNDAKRELKFLLIYLHNEDCEDTLQFCRNTLSDPLVIQYINTHFLFWACSTKTGEGYKVMQLMRCGYYPFVGVVVLKDGRMTIVGRMEGYCDATTFHARLAQLVREFEANLVTARALRVEQSMNRSLRAYQDEAFMESLRADQEKDRKREEEKRAAEEMQRQIEMEFEAERCRKEGIAEEKRLSVIKVPIEPNTDHPDAIHIVIKLPSGTRLERRFLKSHSLESIYFFVFTHPNSPDEFEIITNFPKRTLKCRRTHSQEVIQTIEEAGLKNREVLFVNDLDA